MAEQCRTCKGTGKSGWIWAIDPETKKAKPETLYQPSCQRCGGSGTKR